MLGIILSLAFLITMAYRGHAVMVIAPISAMVAVILAILIMAPKSIKDCITALSDGGKNAVVPVFTTASEVAYGGVIALLAIFAVIAGITGSSSGGLTMAIQSFAEYLIPLADARDISLDFLHRAMAMTSVSLDSLPHNGASVTLLLVTGMTHRQSYKDIGVVTVIVPFIGIVAIIALGFLFPTLQ
ncbi:hypothetical protein [Corynebacterium deserti]|uniref:hypothetical protein n=1 Tax=Corynebacterium deserti TaxID=1408191 RepID=UPI0006AD1B4A|nr:hypothetical protein [Corynebacterium deserti]